MLFPPQSVSKQMEKLTRRLRGSKDRTAVMKQILALDPDFGGTYLALGMSVLEEGRLDEAEGYLWRGLSKQPCTHHFYLALASMREEEDATDQLSRDLQFLTFRKLWMSPEIPKDAAELIQKAFGQGMQLDFRDPESYGLLLAGWESHPREGPADPRLRPYLLFDRLQEQVGDTLDEDLLGQILSKGAEVAPVLSGALHEWVRYADAIDEPALSLAVALLGEVGTPADLPDLLELSALAIPSLFLHSHWAVWRMGQRFPEQTIETFGDRIPGANCGLRCGIAEHLSVMPRHPLIPGIAKLMLVDFQRFAGEPDVAYLAAAARHALTVHGCAEEFRRMEKEINRTLGPQDREWLEQFGEIFRPRIEAEGIPKFNIEDICVRRVLMTGDEPGAPEAPEAGNLRVRLFGDVLQATNGWDPGRTIGQKAFELFFGPVGSSPPVEGADAGFGEWYLCDFRAAPSAETAVERYLRESAARLKPREKALLEAWRDSRFGLYEVQRVERGEGIEVRDLSGPDVVFIHDITSSERLVQWDCLLCRLVFFEGKWEFEGNGIVVPRVVLGELRTLVKRESAGAGLAEGAWVRANCHQLHRRIEEMARARLAKVKVKNFEGDPVEFSSAVYKVKDEDKAVSGLRACPEFEDQENGEFAWLDSAIAGKPRRAYGRVQIRGGRLLLECDSRRRLERGRGLVEKFAGDHLRHLGDAFERLKPAGKARKAAPAPEIPLEIQREIIGKFKEEHYGTWPDQPLPALRGKTSNQAVRTKEGRRAVEDLLRDMENSEARSGGPGAYDFSKLRAPGVGSRLTVT